MQRTTFVKIIQTIGAFLLVVAWSAPAAAISVSTTLATATGLMKAELRIDRQQHARILTTETSTGKSRTIRLITPDEVLPILLDRRLAAFWPALVGWAGADLGLLRNRLLEESKAAFARGDVADRRIKGYVLNPKAQAIYGHATILSQTGHNADAEAMLVDAIDHSIPKDTWQRQDRGSLIVLLASILAEEGRTGEAVARLASFEKEAVTRAEILNVMGARAILQAQTGHYAEALAAAGEMATLYGSYAKTIGGMMSTVPGSSRAFASIRACALHGLGREEEAKRALAELANTPEPHSLLIEVRTTVAFRRSAARCMRDENSLAAALADSLNEAPFSPDLASYLNAQVRSTLRDPPLLAAARARPAYAEAARDIVRQLPDELAPASNAWRN